MMVKPTKTLELHYPMIQFLITSDIPQFLLGNFRSRDALRPIARERKDLMDYKGELLFSAEWQTIKYFQNYIYQDL